MTAGLMVQPPVRLFAHGAVIIDPMPQRIDAGIADDGGFALDRAHGLEHRRHDLGRRHVLLLVEDRKSTRLNSSTNAHLVCRLLLEKKNNIHYQSSSRHMIKK